MLFVVENGIPVGFALLSSITSLTFLGRAGIYLEDLSFSRNIGERPWKSNSEKNWRPQPWNGAAAVWNGDCLDWNRPSIDFYLSLGAEPMEDWTTYRFSGNSPQKNGRN